MKNLLKRGSSVIQSALLKYGHNNLIFKILEYCEQKYLDLLKAEYNICKVAGFNFRKITYRRRQKKKR
jgi:hypothetical protein